MNDWRTAVPKKDWVDGRSAKRLAETWWPARGFPAPVLSALSAVEHLRGLVPVSGLIEHRTDVPGRGAGSATDLLVHARSATGAAVLAVEAKVDEGFDKTIRAWRLAGESRAAAINRDQRYKSMCDALKIAPARVLDARYQLLHRTYAAWKEACDKGAGDAIMLVHSFADFDSPPPGWFDFEAFTALVRPGSAPSIDHPLNVAKIEGVRLWLVWVQDGGGVKARARR